MVMVLECHPGGCAKKKMYMYILSRPITQRDTRIFNDCPWLPNQQATLLYTDNARREVLAYLKKRGRNRRKYSGRHKERSGGLKPYR